jgi:hypothetical protein
VERDGLLFRADDARALRRAVGAHGPEHERQDGQRAGTRGQAPARGLGGVPPSRTITLVLALCCWPRGPHADLEGGAPCRRLRVERLAVWDNSRYGGHPLPGSSLTFPVLGPAGGAGLIGAAATGASAGHSTRW